MTRLLKPALLALGLLATATPPALAASCAQPPGARTEVQRVVAETNAARAARGLPPLQVSPTLTRAAQGHACAMVATGTFSHRLPGSSGPKSRIGAAGCRTGLAAENIAMGYSSASKTMGLWLNSPGHKRNILARGVTTIGVAVAAPKPGQGGGPRWVQVFAKGC